MKYRLLLYIDCTRIQCTDNSGRLDEQYVDPCEFWWWVSSKIIFDIFSFVLSNYIEWSVHVSIHGLLKSVIIDLSLKGAYFEGHSV